MGMETGVTKLDRGRARRDHTKPEKQVGSHQPNRKRRRIDKDEDAADHTRKRPKGQESLNKRYHNPQGRLGFEPSGRSPPSQAIRGLNQQQIARTETRTRSLPRTSETHQYVGQEQPQAEHSIVSTPRKSKQYRVPENKNEGQSKLSPTDPEAQRIKRRRSINGSDLSSHDAKRPKHSHVTPQSRPRQRHCKEDFIENWLSESCWSRRTLTDDGTLLRELPDSMSRKPADVLPSPDDSFTNVVSTSRKSGKSAASVHDTDYHQSMRYRNIFIEREDPPVEMMRRAQRIILRPRASPEMDDAAVKELKNKARRLRNEAEDVIAKQLAPHLIPAIDEVPDSRLTMNSDQQWSNFVPVPLDPDVLTNPLPLPKPKPDLTFGYSEAAFDRKQLMTIDLLVDDQFGRSYAVPDQKLRFPFLDVEFKSQAKNGTHYVATNQVAGAGAIALNGNLELIRRSFGAESFDFDEPHFFSVTMDHQLACVNVHWVRNPAEGGQYSFHVEGLSTHLLSDVNGLRSLRRAIKNILDHGSDVRLRKLCEALDAYRQRVVSEREAVTTEPDQGNMVQTEPQPERRRRSRRAQLPSHKQQYDQSRDDLKEEERRNAEENQGDGPQENLQAQRRSRRKQTRARQGRSWANVPSKAMRSKRDASAVQSD
ncbi:MAG: hypothetical protein Q9179_001647 [Wetmoreana sp. 5 TL-2023]